MGPDRERAARVGRPLSHDSQSHPRAPLTRRRETPAIVGHSERDGLGVAGEQDFDVARGGMTEGVAHGFLRNTEELGGGIGEGKRYFALLGEAARDSRALRIGGQLGESFAEFGRLELGHQQAAGELAGLVGTGLKECDNGLCLQRGGRVVIREATSENLGGESGTDEVLADVVVELLAKGIALVGRDGEEFLLQQTVGAGGLLKGRGALLDAAFELALEAEECVENGDEDEADAEVDEPIPPNCSRIDFFKNPTRDIAREGFDL